MQYTCVAAAAISVEFLECVLLIPYLSLYYFRIFSTLQRSCGWGFFLVSLIHLAEHYPQCNNPNPDIQYFWKELWVYVILYCIVNRPNPLLSPYIILNVNNIYLRNKMFWWCYNVTRLKLLLLLLLFSITANPEMFLLLHRHLPVFTFNITECPWYKLAPVLTYIIAPIDSCFCTVSWS